jgi:hypothetical protein
MTSKTIVLRILDAVAVVFLAVLALSATGLPVEWLPRLFHMSSGEFRGFSFFMAFAAMLLMHAIATSDSAP